MVRRTIPGCASLFTLTLEPNLCACLKRAKDGLIGLFFPPRCVGCDREGDFICAACRQCLPYLVPPLCKSCGRPLITDNCPSCRKWRLEINGIRSPYAFEGIMKQAIYRLKYGQWKVLAAPLGGLLAQYAPTASLPMDVLAPVPLHPRRLRERGYNQSALLAREMGRLLDIPVIEGCLGRKSNGRAQARTAQGVLPWPPKAPHRTRRALVRADFAASPETSVSDVVEDEWKIRMEPPGDSLSK